MPDPVIIIIALATFVATLLGGLVALRFRDKLHLILGFSAGAVIGAAFFDLLPEALVMGGQYYSQTTIATLVAGGFLAYLIMDRVAALHTPKDVDHPDDKVRHPPRGSLGAGSLVVHSFLDGIVIGLAFQVGVAVGAVVAAAVLAHDFSDGVNTVGLVLRKSGERSRRAFYWLLADALAPVAGAGSTLFFILPERGLAVILALFCGFFLYIGASDLVPESQHAHPKFLTTIMTLLGAAVLYSAASLAQL